MNRINDYNHILEGLPNIVFTNQNSIVVNGDSLDILRHMPAASVSLILTDPPYHSTKKSNIINDKAFSTDQEFIDWIESYAQEWRRILKPNGSIFMFCSSCMEAKLENMLSRYFNILSHIVWTKPNEPGYDGWKGKMKKEALRQWYPHSERIIFMEMASEGNLKRSYFGNYLKKVRSKCGLSGKDLTEMIGAYGKVNHGGAVSNWESGRNIPSKEQYYSICDALKKSGMQDDMPAYEDIIRPFEVNASVEFTDVWTFPSVKQYKGKHPAEKPIDLLEHCIKSTTFKGDIVLDCFAGSGSSIVAALRTGRIGVAIEIDRNWCDTIVSHLYDSAQMEEESDVKKIMRVPQHVETPSLFD